MPSPDSIKRLLQSQKPITFKSITIPFSNIKKLLLNFKKQTQSPK